MTAGEGDGGLILENAGSRVGQFAWRIPRHRRPFWGSLGQVQGSLGPP